MKKFLSLLFLTGLAVFNTASAQVEVAATAGDPLRNYTTLGAAFDAINNGVHQADIVITILGNTTETGPAVLHSGDADPCSYTSVLIIPQGNRTIAGPTTTGRGLIELNGADNVTIDGGGTLTIRNTAANTITFTSVIRIAVSSNVPSSENVLIQNVIIEGNVTGGNSSLVTATTNAANASFGIYVGGNGGAAPLSPPTALSTDATWFSQPAPSGTTVKGFQANSNTITNVGRGIVFNSSSASVSTGITISGNTIGASGALTTYPFTTPTNTVYMKGITVSGTDAVSISNNTIRNIISYIPGIITTSGLSGIELTAAIGSGAIDINDNTITGVSFNGTTGNGVADGINIMSSGATYNIARNNISNIYSGASSSVGAASGIRINTDESPGNIINNRISNIFGQNTGGYGAKGINLWLAGNGCLIQNNFIWNLHNHNNSSFANTFNVTGILLNTGNDHKVYHNSVNLYGTPLAGTTTNSYACFSISANTQTGIDVRNNIFQNKVVTGATSGASVCVFLPFTVSSAMNLTLNHNAYFTHASADGGVAFAGSAAYAAASLYSAANFIPNQTIPATNFRNFSHQLGQVSNDYASFGSTANAPFVSNTDLHITGGPSQVESGGFPGLTAQDIDNQARAAWPDMGADEATLTVSDLTAPLISFVPFTNTCTIGGTRVLSVTITDRAGVPTAGAGLPMLYYRINGGGWTGIQAVFISGSTYQFTMPNGGAVGDLVEYYIVAQDALGNVITSPYQGSAGPFTTNPPAVTTVPTTLQSFSVQNVLPAGTYTVGAAGNYPSLTAAVNAYNNSCLGGAIIFELIDVAQPSGEVFPISINNNPFSSSTNTLTIRPANGVAVNWGAATHPQAIIKLNGSDYVTINGQNGTGTWALRNTNSGTSATVIWITSSSTNSADGATNNTITNMTLQGVTQSQTIACILAGSGTTLGNPASASNNNNTISNNVLIAAQNGIYINGSSGTPDANWSITNNTIGSSAWKMGYRGLSVQRVNNYTISGNQIRFVELSSSSPATGIAIFNTATNGNIFNNLVDSLTQSSTSGGAYGIYLAGNINGANVNVYNNRVRGVKANGSATLNNNSFGINVTDGGGYNIYYNSVSMTANQTATTGTTAALRVASGVTTLNVRNNIFSNTQTQAGSRFAIHVGGNSSTFSNINYNDYYSTNFLGFLGSNITTLSAWQAATGNDSKSVNVNPLFVSVTDLHLQNTSALNGLAQPIGTITADFESDARNGTTPDIGADEFVPANCAGIITGGTITASATSFCVSGSATLTSTGFTTGNGMSYQWQYSTAGAGGPWFNLTPGGVNQVLAPNAATGTISNTTWYRLVATCSFSGTGNSNIISISVNNPSVQSVTPGTRCGTGTVDLAATLGPGSIELNWYDAPTGGVPLGTGTNFTTPTISSTTTYYVSASAGGSVSLNVPHPPVSTSGFHTNTVGWGLRFNVLQQLTINTVDMYPSNSSSGPASIQIIIRDNSDAILYTGPVHNFTVGTTHSLQVVPVGITIPAGGPYKMTMVSTGINSILRNLSGGGPYPWSAPGYLDIVSSSNGAGGATSTTTYYWFYNWSISVGCESPRTPVQATVTPAPAITATATPTTICQGQSTTLSASSANAGYSYSWTPGGAGASISVSPAVTTTYTLNALDVPNGTPNDGCQTSTTVTVTVNDLPGVVDVTPNNPSVCAGAGTVLTATGGNVDGSVEFDAGVLNLPIPDNNVNGISHTLAVAGIPGGATIDSMVVTLNIPNPWVADVAVSLRAPNNQVLNLISGIAGSVAVASADNFTNTRISSDNTKPALLSGTAPYTGTFRASGATSGFQIAFVPAVTTASWPTLWGTVNGNWTLHVYDDEGALTGTLTNWKLKIYYKASATIAWTPAAGLNTTTGPTVTATPSSTTMYYATATNAAGCTRVDSSQVTVNTALLSAVTAVPICPGANATIRVNFTGPGPWNITYTANGGSPVTVNGINTNPYDITVNPNVTTTYQLTAASNGSCNITAAALPATAVIDVHPQPNVSITPSPASVCQGGTSTLTASGTAGTYLWSGAGLSSTTGNPVTATPPLVGGNAYSVTVTDANGCSATIGTNVTVNPNLPVSVSVTPSANPVCTGNSVTFTANATNPGTGTPYQWQVNGINQGAPTSSNTFTYTPANNDQVTVIVTSNATCATGSPATSTPVVMSVQASTAASVTLASSGALCSGNSITFTATPTGGGASPNFEFFVGAASVQNGTSNTYTYTPANGDNVSVIMTSSLACATGSPATSNTVTVTFFAAPTTTPTATCTNLMAGNSTTLSANAVAGSGTISSIQWQLGGVDIGGATAATYTTTVAGSYTVVITNSNGCITTSTPIVINAVTGALNAGTYTIDPSAPACNNFTSIANAAAYINQYGITGGAVIFNVPAAYTETALNGGIVIGSATLNASTSSTNTITFQKNGAGVNPLVTAFTPQTGGSGSDAVIKIVGADYITFDAIDVRENPANAAVTNMTEFGYGIFYLTTTDGAQNATIRNSVITLNKTNTNTFGVYSTSRHSSTSITTADAAASTGNNNNLRVYGNTITNVNTGIMVVSPVALPGTGLDIGGTAIATGNTITDFGTLNSAIASVPANNTAGITTAAQIGVNISYNSITSAAAPAITNTIRGIYVATGGAIIYPGAGSFTHTINNNTVSVKTSTGGGAITGIQHEVGNSLFTVSISNNNFTDIVNTAGAPTGAFNYISNTAANAGQTINGNTFTNLTANTTGTVNFISNTGALQSGGVQNVNNNSIVTGFTKNGGGGTINFYIGVSSAVAGTTVAHNNNNFSNVTINGGTATTLNGWVSPDVITTNKTVSGNTFNAITNNTTGTTNILRANGTPSPGLVFTGNTVSNISFNQAGLFSGIDVPLGNTLLAQVTNNTVSNITNAGTGQVNGINVGTWVLGTTTGNTVNGLNGNGILIGINGPLGVTVTPHLIDQNTITGLTSGGAGGNVTGIICNPAGTTFSNNIISSLTSSGATSNVNGITTGGNATVNNNTIHTLSSSGTGNPFVNGLLIGAGTTNVYKNRIYNLSFTGTFTPASGAVSGIQFIAASNATVYNNYISDLKATGSGADNTVRGIHMNGTGTVNFYYNTIYLNASGTTNFGASGIFHSAAGTFNLRNSIIVNESVASGTGRVVAYRRSAAISASYANSSNNNVLYGGVPSASNLIFFDGTNSDQTIAAFQARVTPRDNLSLGLKPTFINIAAAPFDLHIKTDANCSLDGGAAPIPGFTDDYDNDVRNATTPDIGADEFNGTGTGAGVWKGVNSNWMDVANWCDAVPGPTTNVLIPSGAPFYPIITTTGPMANNLTIQAGASINMSGAGEMVIYGTIANSGIFNALDGTIEMAGSSPQTIAAGTFTGNDVKNFVINNASVTLSGPLDVFGKVSFKGSNRTFATAGNLTLKSTATGTASLGDITNNTTVTGNQVTGDVQIERFASARRAWRFLSVPTMNNLQTIKQAWQENQPANSTALSGLGIHITSERATWAADGFDIQTPNGPSLKTYVPATDTWLGVPTTHAPFTTGEGYMVLVRGDRTVNTFPQAATTTVLRDKGALVQGNFGPIAVGANQFEAIGNPYASAVDFTKLTKAGIQDVYYVWDPSIGTLGAYVTFAGPTYDPVPNTGNFNLNKYIESGSAFFVRGGAGGGSVSFTEPSKVDGSNLVQRINGFEKRLRANMYATINGERIVHDGIMAEFDNAYANGVDENDAIKFNNSGENLGITRDGRTLAMERRKEVHRDDTIYMRLGQLRAQPYEFEFVPSNLNEQGLKAYLEDLYLGTYTEVSLAQETTVSFSINSDPRSFAADRFRIVFKRIPPVKFITIKATPHQQHEVKVEWSVEDEVNVANYTVQHSVNGTDFSPIGSLNALNAETSSYNSLHHDPVEGVNYYRIMSTSQDGEHRFSAIAEVIFKAPPVLITLYPNPVGNDKVVNVNLSNMPAGNYTIVVSSVTGQEILRTTLQHGGRTGVYPLRMNGLSAHGTYLVAITGQDRKRSIFKIVY